jgi:hypothetical protein
MWFEIFRRSCMGDGGGRSWVQMWVALESREHGTHFGSGSFSRSRSSELKIGGGWGVRPGGVECASLASPSLVATTISTTKQSSGRVFTGPAGHLLFLVVDF